ncbi:MAG: TldD/PmbA family protein [Candidatus Aminicenantes bacterium]|nr:TldD/PmbA family protein [Candidatus Aminicenantes bacterium]
MDKFKVQLYEESQDMQLAMDSRGGREFSLHKRSGIQWRSFAGGWKSRSLETGYGEEAAAALSLKSRGLPDPLPLPADAGEILAAGAFLARCLQRHDLQEWKLQFRAHCCRRLIRNTHRQLVRNVFRHFSVSAAFKARGQAEELRVGEGNGEGTKFNLDGLGRRIAEALEEQKNRGRVALDCQVPVVLQAGEGAILFHEVLGHALEADYVCRGSSPFTPADLGRAIVPESITILGRDPRDPFFREAAVDDEGETCPSPVLVERGVLRRFISDTACQKILRLKDRGHARLEDFRRIPQPRMFATYVQPGPLPAAEIVASTPRGIFARDFGEGGLDLRSDSFYFRIRRSSLIEKGRLTAPLGPLVVRGRLRDILHDIVMVGDDFRYDRGLSYCQKNGQVLPVRVGQPTVKIGKLWVSERHGS